MKATERMVNIRLKFGEMLRTGYNINWKIQRV